jgi:carbonic anhydrase
MVPAPTALDRLREGNRRFVANVRGAEAILSQLRRAEMVFDQHPFAIVLGCSDSRVPAEIVFDQGLGDLFVIRVAGNVVAASQVGSVEFAAERFGTRLVVVMGHTHCGAVLETLQALTRGGAASSRNVMSIVDRIRPAVEPLLETELAHDAEALRRAAVRANVRASAGHLRHGSELLERMVAKEGLLIVGAEYDLRSGVVDFFENVPEDLRGTPAR